MSRVFDIRHVPIGTRFRIDGRWYMKHAQPDHHDHYVLVRAATGKIGRARDEVTSLKIETVEEKAEPSSIILPARLLAMDCRLCGLPVGTTFEMTDGTIWTKEDFSNAGQFAARDTKGNLKTFTTLGEEVRYAAMVRMQQALDGSEVRRQKPHIVLSSVKPPQDATSLPKKAFRKKRREKEDPFGWHKAGVIRNE